MRYIFTPRTIPDTMRAFDDMRTTRRWLEDATLGALKNRFPYEHGDYRLDLDNVRMSGSEPGMARQKQALMTDERLRRPIKGHWRLSNRHTGDVLDEKDGTVMHIPYITDRGTIINKGNEYSFSSQQRLSPGVYTRKKESGEYEALFNVKPRTGRTFRVWMEPDTGVFRLNVAQANVPLYPLMQVLGVDDDELAKRWGPEILAANKDKRDAHAIDKLYTRLVPKYIREGEEPVEPRQAIIDAISGAGLDPDVVARTLGLENKDHVDGESIVRAAEKLLQVSRGEAEPDDRDSPSFSTIHGIEDMIAERVENDAGRLLPKLMMKLRRDGTLSRMPSSALDGYVDNYILGSRVVQPTEETNPLSLLEQVNRITRMGVGGIGDPDAVTEEARCAHLKW